MMRIDKETKYFAVAPLLRCLPTEKIKEIEQKAVECVLGADGFMGLTIGQLIRLMNSDITAIIGTKDPNEITVFDYYTINQIRTFVDDYIGKLEGLNPIPTNEERAAQKICLKVSAAEGFLLFAREYFGLHSFSDAEKVTLADFLIAKKDVYNKAMYQRELNRIMTIKANKKR